MYAYYHHELCIIIAQTVSGGEKSKGKGIGIGTTKGCFKPVQ